MVAASPVSLSRRALAQEPGRVHRSESNLPCELIEQAAAKLDATDAWLVPALRKRGWSDSTLQSIDQFARSETARGRSQRLGDALLRLGFLTASQWAELVAERLGWPLVRHLEAPERREAAPRLSPETGRRLGLVALPEASDGPVYALVDPRRLLTPDGRDVLRKSLGADARTVSFRVVAESDLNVYYDLIPSAGEISAERSQGRKLIEELLREAVQEEASDIHFIPRERAVEVRYRIDGRLWTRHLFGLDRKEEILANAKIAGGLDIGRRGEPLDGAGSISVGSRIFKLRYSSMPSQFGQQVVIRLLDQDATALPLEQLGLSPGPMTQLLDALNEPQGLIFLVGPTGSGKSTTLASLLGHLDGQAFSIRTLENPIEYRLANAVQSEVSGDMTFAGGLRALLRQDPDYILVGETRDLETAEIAIEAGLTGHMCLSTLHANDALGGVVRLLDLGVDVGPLLASCRLFVAQRLVRRLCRRCARPREDAAEVAHRLGLRLAPGEGLWEPVGCAYCRDGYRGRLGLYEVRDVRHFEPIIQQEGPGCARRCREEAAARGLPTLRSEGFAKALAGLTTVEEVLAQAPA